jgi:tripeptide aminopeptidase
VRADEAEKRRVTETFVRLCEIESPSGSELAVARAVRAELEGAGLEVREDHTQPATGAGCGNLIARIPGPPAGRRVLLGAHLDTVPLTGRVEVALVDGVFTNRREAILGADNKAAVAVMLEIARRFGRGGSQVGVDLVFTTSEENGLRGAKALDLSLIEAGFGYVLDHASPIGELIVAAPTYYLLGAELAGRAAHAGIRPEEGRSAIAAAAMAIDAMSLGRIDDQTTVNVGRIEGGTAPNVVPERCRIEAEVRSLDHARATSVVGEVVDRLTWAASSTETDVDTEIVEQFRAYRLKESEPHVAAAAAALRDCGIEPIFRSTGGGSDANAFNARGLPVLNIANGTEANHTPEERVSVAALESMLDVTLSLLARAAEV